MFCILAFIFYLDLTSTWLDWVITLVAVVGCWSLAISPFIHAADKLSIRGSLFQSIKPRNNEEIDLSSVESIQLSFYFFQSYRGYVTIYPEFIFKTGDEVKTFTLYGEIFLTEAKQILANLLHKFPDKSYSLKWSDTRHLPEYLELYKEKEERPQAFISHKSPAHQTPSSLLKFCKCPLDG